MKLAELSGRADDIKRLYEEQNRQAGRREWGTAEYAQGFVVDVGDLVKLVMARNGYRDADEVDRRIAHELTDCLWSILVLAREFEIDLETAFIQGMDDLEQRIAGTKREEG